MKRLCLALGAVLAWCTVIYAFGFGGGGGSSTPIATTAVAGKVKPDGSTITVQADGTISAPTGGSGNVSGPASSTDGEAVIFSGTGGKTIKRSNTLNGLSFLTNGVVSTKAIGTDVQAYHANLAAIAGGTWTGANSITTVGTLSAGSIPYTLLSGTVTTWNQNTTGYASSVKSPATTGVSQFTGPGAGTTRVKTVRDANDTILELGGSYTPSGSWDWTSATLTMPTLNQNTSGTAANLSGTPALPNGTTATTQAKNDNSTKLLTTAGLMAQTNTATSAGIVATGAGAVNKVWKTDASGNPDWRDDSTGGTPTFDTVGSGTNVASTMTVGAGGTLTYSTTGIVNASQYKGQSGPSAAQFGYVDFTSSGQTQINAKASSASPTLTGLVTVPDYSAGVSGLVLGSTALQTNAARLNYLSAAAGTTGTTSSNVVFSANPTFTTGITTPAITLGATALTPTGTELNYVSGVTSAIQGQLDGKAAINANTTGSAGSLKSTGTTGIMNVTGMGAATTRTKTVRDANDTILELGGNYTPTGTWNFQSLTGTWPTFNQNTTGSAATLTTPRAIYGNNFDGSAALSQIIASAYGGTGNGFTKFSGPATAEKTFTLPNASATILTSNSAVTAAQGGTGQDSSAWSGVPRVTAGTWSSGYTVGTSANNLVQLDSGAKLPAVDGSQLTNLPVAGGALAANGTTPLTANWNAGAYTITAAGFSNAKTSGTAGAIDLYEANSTDTDTAGFKGPASLVNNTSYRGQFPNARATGANRVLAWTNVGETGTGTPLDPYTQAMSFFDLGTLLPLSGGTLTGKVTTATNGTAAGLNLTQSASDPSSPVNGDLWILASGLYARIAGSTVGPFSTGAPAFSSVTAGTNTNALVIGNSGSLAPSGTGTIQATSINAGTGKATFTGTSTDRSYTLPDAATTLCGTNAVCTGYQSSVTFGTGVQTALGVNVGTAGAPVVNGGALGTPSSGTLTNATGLPISGLTASTSTAIGVGSVELGHSSDTTIARSAAGKITVESNPVAFDATQTSTHASPSTTTPLSPTWVGVMHTVWYGATGTINLPAAAGYTGRGILIYNTGAFTITIDSNASEVIVRDGTAQTGGVSITLSSGAGNYVALVCDGSRWVTVGYKGTLAQGS